MNAAAAAMSAATVAQQSIATFALHALWQTPLLAVATCCAVRIGRPQARIAHVLWVAALILCVVLPACSTLAARKAALAAERNAQVAVSYEPPADMGLLQPMKRQPAWKRMLRRHLNSRDGLQPFTVAVPRRWARAITFVWLVVLAVFSAQLVIGWFRVRRLVNAASGDPLPRAVDAALQQQCAALHMHAPATKLHDGIAGPLLAGVLRPVLLLPSASANEMGGVEIDAVLAHELAHLRRCDPVVHAACSLLLLPVCFHPCAWWVVRCVRQTREMACDAEAAERLGSPAEYAWALLQVAERSSNEDGRAAAAGLFSNGLFGAGLQLFTNRGAMEERMQMLMNGDDSKGKGRAVRAAVAVSLAAVAVVAATMLQIQPTLAAERSLPQAAKASSAPAAPTPAPQESGPALIGGDHAREQLRRAHRQLTQAESQATSAEDRKKIEGAQQAVALAEQALNAVDAPSGAKLNLDVSGLDQIVVRFKDLKVPDEAAIRLGMEKQRQAMDKLQAQMNSPEWRAQMDEVRKLDQATINAMLAKARTQQEKAMEQLRSSAIQRQIEQARLMARVEPPPMPFAEMPPAPLLQQDANSTLKVAPAVMAGNKIGGSNPVYPPAAKEKRIQGPVVLHAIIDKAGHVETIQVVSSPDDQLSKSAVDAVQTWIYKPYLLNGNPMAVETMVTVTFSLVQ